MIIWRRAVCNPISDVLASDAVQTLYMAIPTRYHNSLSGTDSRSASGSFVNCRISSSLTMCL